MIKKFLKNILIFFRRQYAKLLIKISPKLFIEKKYQKLFGKKPDLDNPQTFAEKIQWLKLNLHDPLIVECADKYLVRDRVKSIIGEEYLIKMIGAWDKPEDVDFDSLPQSFVLKPNNSSGRVLICKDKSQLDIKSAKKKMKSWEKENLTKETGEWVYEKIPFKIVCEEYLADDIMDYKMYYAHGKFICTQVIAGRSKGAKQFGYFDSDWKLLDIRRYKAPQFTYDVPKPEQYEDMLRIGDLLSKDFVFSRIDLYYVNGKVYFGEISFYPNNGFVRYETEEMDKFFSDKIVLPIKEVCPDGK